MSTSYPFLTLARRLGVDYGAVLAFADLLDTRGRETATQRRAALTLSLEQKLSIEQLCKELRFHPVRVVEKPHG